MGGHGHGGHGGGHGGGFRWGGGGFPRTPYYSSALIDPMPQSSFYRGYVITESDAGYDVSEAASTAVIANFGSQDEARAFIDALIKAGGLKGLGDDSAGFGLGTIAVGLGIAYLVFKRRR